MNRFRSLLTRWAKRPENYLGLLQFVCGLIAYRCHRVIRIGSKHGSWLNMAEVELSLLSCQCLKPRVPDTETLRREVAAWQTIRKAHQARLRYSFRLEDARRKLHHLYPAPLA